MIVVGHSHMYCVIAAASRAGLPFTAISLRPRDQPVVVAEGSTWLTDPGNPAFGPEAMEVLTRADSPVFAFVGGTKHDRMALSRLYDDPSEPLFDFVLPEAPGVPFAEGAELVPYAGIRAVMQDYVDKHLALLRRIVEVTPAPIYQFQFPPPAPDHWLESRRERRKQYQGIELPHRFLRLKLWRLVSDIVRTQGDALGVAFVEHPPGVVDEEGFMHDAFVKNATHANPRYGRLVLEQMKALA